MQQPTCTICGDPTDATVCRRETASLAEYLRTVIVVAADVEVSVARLARYGDRGGRAALPVESEPDEDDSDERRPLPVMVHGWAARLDKPARGALVATALPFQPGMARQADAAITAITTWARHVCDERGFRVSPPAPVQGPTCRAGYGCRHRTCVLIRTRSIGHPAAWAAVFLLTQLEWIRHRPEADEIVEDLSAAAATLRRCVDAPPALRYAGPCWAQGDGGECEQELYAMEGAATVRCPACGTAHDVGLRRAWLLGQTHDVLLNAATMATALSSLDHLVTSSMIRNYADRGRIVAHGQDRDGRPTYRVGDVLEVLADVARRKTGVAA